MSSGYIVLPRPDTSDISINLTGDVSGSGPSPITTTVNSVGAGATSANDITTTVSYVLSSLFPGPISVASGGTNNGSFDANKVIISNGSGDQLISSEFSVTDLDNLVSRSFEIKTSNFNIPEESGDKIYMVNTTGGAVTASLPNPTADVVIGQLITIVDQKGTWATHSLTISKAGDELFAGSSGTPVFSTNWTSITFFSDGTDWFYY